MPPQGALDISHREVPPKGANITPRTHGIMYDGRSNEGILLGEAGQHSMPKMKLTHSEMTWIKWNSWVMALAMELTKTDERNNPDTPKIQRKKTKKKLILDNIERFEFRGNVGESDIKNRMHKSRDKISYHFMYYLCKNHANLFSDRLSL